MAMVLVSSFPERLKLALLDANITATEIGERIGISKQAVSTYLTGKRSPN